MKKLSSIVPEFYFILVSLLLTAENYFSNGKINYFAVLAGWLMFLQLFYKHRLLGIIYASAASAVSAYLLVSSLLKFDVSGSVLPQAIALLFCAGGLVMGIAMVYKYARSTSKYDESILTVSF